MHLATSDLNTNDGTLPGTGKKLVVRSAVIFTDLERGPSVQVRVIVK